MLWCAVIYSPCPPPAGHTYDSTLYFVPQANEFLARAATAHTKVRHEWVPLRKHCYDYYHYDHYDYKSNNYYYYYYYYYYFCYYYYYYYYYNYDYYDYYNYYYYYYYYYFYYDYYYSWRTRPEVAVAQSPGRQV